MIRRPIFAITGLMLTCMIGCKTQPEDAPRPWGHTSERWGYDITMPAEWATFPASHVNKRAEFTARHGERLFMVIPTQMPQLPKLEPEDVRRVKEQSIEQLAGELDDMKIELQGPLTLDGVPGHSVFATGQIAEGEERGIYILSYVYRAPIFYQIVTYAPTSEREQLRKEVDVILATWRFIEPRAASSEG